VLITQLSVCRFYPAPIKKIAEEVLKKYLGGKDYDEDATKEWVVAICDEVKRRAKGRLKAKRRIVDRVSNFVYRNTAECNMPRYKLVVQATLGQMKDQGIRVASRCLWDTSVDNYASVNYETVSSCRKLDVFLA